MRKVLGTLMVVSVLLQGGCNLRGTQVPKGTAICLGKATGEAAEFLEEVQLRLDKIKKEGGTFEVDELLQRWEAVHEQIRACQPEKQ